MLVLIDHPFNEGSSLPTSPLVSPNGIILTQVFHVSVIWNITHDPSLYFFFKEEIFQGWTQGTMGKGAVMLNLLSQLNGIWNHQGNTSLCVYEGVSREPG